jgi:hypothetical protein
MGSSGIKRRKPRRRLPKVKGELPRPEMNQATALSPAVVPQVYGNIARATRSAHKRRRRMSAPLALIVGLPMLLLVVMIAVVSFATR